MASPALLIKAGAALIRDERIQKAVGWTVVALLSPLILLVAFFCALGSGTSSHNVSAVELCFNGGTIPANVPAEYRACLEEMQGKLSSLGGAVTSINGQTENGTSLDSIRVRAIFYALYFGAEAQGDTQTFTDCFVTYEERTRTVTIENENGDPVETEETYTVPVPIEDMPQVYQNIRGTLGIEVTEEHQGNADSIYNLVKYGWAGSGTGGVWSGDIGEPVLSVDGFCSPLGSGWQSRVTSEFGWRNCPYHGRELHSGLDMAAAAGTPIRAALSGVVTKSCRTSSYGNYTVIDHGNGMTTAYAHQSERLVKVGDTVNVGDVIGLVGSTGNSTGPHLHLEVRANGSLVNPRNYLP